MNQPNSPLHKEFIRIQQMLSGYSISWAMQSIHPDILTEIDNKAELNDPTISEIRDDIFDHFGLIEQPDHLEAMGQAFDIYAEANAYLTLTSKGLTLERTPGTGAERQERPDFKCTLSSGDILYFEIKALDFQGGLYNHKELADRALNVAADLDSQSKQPGVYIGELEISPFTKSFTPTDRIEALINKISGAIKRDQIRYGPTVLIIDLGRLGLDASHPSCLTPVYYTDDDNTGPACVSGELWHIALGQIGDMIYRMPDFPGQSNLDRPLEKAGILHDYPELLGISFFTPTFTATRPVYSIQHLQPDTNHLKNQLTLGEHDIGELFYDISDAINDNTNTYAFQHCKRS